jgi:hypothetical protein
MKPLVVAHFLQRDPEGRGDINQPSNPRVFHISAVKLLNSADAEARRSPAEKVARPAPPALRTQLRREAARSGELTADDYDLTRTQILESGKHSSKENALARILPTSGQVIQIVRRIEAAELRANETAEVVDQSANAERAGTLNKRRGKSQVKAPKKTRELLPEIEDAERRSSTRPRLSATGIARLFSPGSRHYEPDKSKGVPVAYAIHLYIEATGLLPPSTLELKRFASEASFSLRHLSREPDYIAGQARKPFFPKTAELRASLGLPMADELANTRKEKPVFDLAKLPSGLPRPVPIQDSRAENEDPVIEALCEYLDTVAARSKRQPLTSTTASSSKEGAVTGLPRRPSGGSGRSPLPAWIEKAQVEWQKRKKRKKQSGSKAT